jgi:tetratricopeptide (TPR) repeat protein
MAIMSQLLQGNVAVAERRALTLKQQFPKEDVVLETLTQIYLTSGRMPEALASIEQQLQVEPANQRALLNKAAVSIHLKAYDQAIPPLNKVLAAQPENSAALMNRGIANLQSGRLDAAQQDYEALQRLLPRYHAVYYGLGEIALRRNDKAAALRNFETYLKYGRAGSAEYQIIEQKVQQLKS